MIRPLLLLPEDTNLVERLEKRIFERDVAAGLLRNIRIRCIKELDGEIIGVLGISDVYNTNPIVRNLESIGSSQRNFLSISASLAFNVREETVAASFGPYINTS
jgi:hypothetical protein